MQLLGQIQAEGGEMALSLQFYMAQHTNSMTQTLPDIIGTIRCVKIYRGEHNTICNHYTTSS